MRFAAALVHMFTALGAVCALLATLALLEGAYERMFWWLGLAFFIDGVDGTFARAVDVTRQLPRFSGERLDLVVDYLTYVFVPVLALLRAGFLSGATGLVFASAILLSALFHFSDLASKGEDNSFVGFPAIWNIVAFYLFAFATAPLVSAVVVVACIVLTFVPWPWVHPARALRLRALNIAVTALWCLAAAAILYYGFPATAPMRAVLLAVAVYGMSLSLKPRSNRPA